jgi:ABC-type uncharacterized transport system permease subunit
MKIEHAKTMQMYYDNQVARYIITNLIFHERTKYIEVDCHFVREKVQSGEITTSFVRSKQQLTYIFTKTLDKTIHLNILN